MAVKLLGEAALHRQVAQYLDLALPADAVWHHSPLQGQGRTRKQGAILHGMGARAGWPDITIIYQGRAYFIELKAPRGTLSAAQHEMTVQLLMAGAQTTVARSLQTVQFVLEEWGIPLKARAA